MRKILFRLAGYLSAFVAFLVLLGVVLGATGFSDKMLGSVINEELRTVQQSLAQTIRDPAELENIMKIRRQELEEFHGLDKAWYTRLPQNILRVLKLDLGEAKTLRSFSGSRNIGDIVLERLPNTLLIMTTSFALVAVLGLSIGVWTARHAGSRADKAISFFAVISNALPAWWIGILAILVLAAMLNWLPAGGMYSSPPSTATLSRLLDVFKHAILPVASLTLVSVGPYLYAIRNITLKISQEPFVQAAYARGLSERRIRWRHILRPAAPPIATSLVLGLVGSFSGAILTETVFNWPGMGRLYADALLGTPDEGIIVALTLMYTMLYMIARFALDISYRLLDPRVRG